MAALCNWTTLFTFVVNLLFLSFSIACLNAGHVTGMSRRTQWESWKEKYHKKYGSPLEEAERRAIWEKNLVFVQQHNAKTEKTFELSMNKFGDQSTVIKSRFPVTPFEGSLEPCKGLSSDLPTSIDWRTKGYVTAVRNQGECGGAVAFGAADTVASMKAIASQTPARVLSAQEVNDCCAVVHRACLPPIVLDKVFDCIHYIGGLCTADVYVKSKNYTCNNDSCTSYAKVPHGGQRVKPGDEVALAAAVATEPVLVGLDANHTSFATYTHGIYTEADCKTAEPNHAMVVVGYGSNNGQDYWICQNSWGADWGMKGYILMARNHGNMCGIASNATFPV